MKQELEDRVKQLEAHNQQLRNILARNDGVKKTSRFKKKNDRKFDFSK